MPSIVPKLKSLQSIALLALVGGKVPPSARTSFLFEGGAHHVVNAVDSSHHTCLDTAETLELNQLDKLTSLSALNPKGSFRIPCC